jgi:hypothetical protein
MNRLENPIHLHLVAAGKTLVLAPWQTPIYRCQISILIPVPRIATSTYEHRCNRLGESEQAPLDALTHVVSRLFQQCVLFWENSLPRILIHVSCHGVVNLRHVSRVFLLLFQLILLFGNTLRVLTLPEISATFQFGFLDAAIVRFGLHPSHGLGPMLVTFFLPQIS